MTSTPYPISQWVDRLGPVPEDPAARLEWAERAGTIAAYQEIVGGSDDDPLGPRPGPGQPDVRARWEAANEALNGLPVAAAQISGEDLQARVDRAAQLVTEAPEVVLDRLRQAHQEARAEQTRAGLVELDRQGGAVVEGSVAADVAPVAGADPERYEEAQQQREDWIADHGAEVGAGPPAAVELARREDERAARPFADLDDDQLHRQTRNAQDDIVALDRRASERVGIVELYRRQAAQLHAETQTVEWTQPTWTKVNQDRQAETDADLRLAAIDNRLDRSALRGGPRPQERAQLQVEAIQLRSAHPALANGADRAPMWDARADKAWADDKATVDRLRGDATALRGKAERVTTTLTPRAEQRRVAQDRLDQLADEGRRRHGQPPRPPASRSTETGRDRTGPRLQPAPGGSLQTAGDAGANRRTPGRAAPTPDAGETPAPQHTPGVDPSQPTARPPSRGPQR